MSKYIYRNIDEKDEPLKEIDENYTYTSDDESWDSILKELKDMKDYDYYNLELSKKYKFKFD